MTPEQQPSVNTSPSSKHRPISEVTASEWRRIKEILNAALDRDEVERARFLDHACADDLELRRWVETLLLSDQEMGDFMAAPTPVPDDLAAATGLTESPGATRFGPYRIVQEIGHGGMGTVYLAERADGQYRMRVAIKLVHPHFGAQSILRRFRTERQVLAALEHPNIARLLDGGTTEDGQLYLVMEYVDGVRIDTWCDNRKLPVRNRLQLFQGVCAAVESAHEKHVIHRDIKPGNILVTADGTPKLLDFGIAKVLSRELSAETVETTIGPGPMTPEYASPEQVQGKGVGPASDVYSLGVLLYNLLAGHPPYRIQTRDPVEIAHAICYEEPVKPSAATGSAASGFLGVSRTGLRRQLAGDLDNIVLKALRKEPERRYATVREFSEDIRRFLEDLPVKARKESLPYRVRKFVKRNRVPIRMAALGAAVVLALVVGLGRIGKSRGHATAVPALKDQRWDHPTIEKLATVGDPAPGGGSFTKDFEPCGLNNRGDLAFVTELSTGNNEGVFLLRKRTVLSFVPIARFGQPAPGGGTFEGGTLGCPSLNDSGDLVFVFSLKPLHPAELKGFTKAGLYRYSHSDGKLIGVVIPGVTPAPGFGVFQSIGAHASLNNSGDTVFAGVVQTTAGLSPAGGLGTGIFLLDRRGAGAKVIAPGDPAPGGGRFDFGQNPWIDDLGDIAFGGHVAGEECIGTSTIGQACLESVYLKNAAKGTVESIAHQGEQAPGGQYYRGAWGPVLNNNGDLVFMGELMPPSGVGSARGVFLRAHGVTVPVAIPGDVMPDSRKIVTVNPGFGVGNYSLNKHGDVTFNAALENGESGLYIYSKGRLHLIAGTGTRIPGVGTISNVANLINGGTLNDSAQVFFWATLTDGTGVLLLATPQQAADAKLSALSSQLSAFSSQFSGDSGKLTAES